MQEYLKHNPSDIFNLGYGIGYSVKEVISTMKKISGVDFKVEETSRRDGDPSSLIADSRKYINTFSHGSQSQLFKYNDLNMICESAYLWETKSPS